MNSILVDGVTYWLPADNNDVSTLIDDAFQKKEIICLRGSAHSFPLIGTLEKGSTTGRTYKYVLLSGMAKVEINKTTGVVKVQAGAHLGLDPFDPTGLSTNENSLLYQLDQAGWAIPDLGGITHQTVGGFLSTGSAGGSTHFSFDEALTSVDLICFNDGKARLVTFNRPDPDDPDDPFYAVGTCMGLFGILVSATFQCVPKFNIIGNEAITKVDDCQIDFFGSGTAVKPNFQTFLKNTQYTRIIWWPQKHVEKSVVWQAKQIPDSPDFKPKPYHEVPYVDGSPIPSTLGADVLFTAMGQWPNWLEDLIGSNDLEYKAIKGLVDLSFHPILFPLICDVFVSVDKKGPQEFQDYWWSGLPMDNQMGDRIMPVWFTELWISIDQTEQVMNALKTFYDSDKKNPGNFCVEIYAAKNSKFWLSPAYNTDVIRIDVFWFGNNSGNPADDFYPRFWNLLQQFNFRPHWGKFLPEGNSRQGVPYLKKLYPKWDNWMALREKLDPEQLFVNDYWRSHLCIKPN